MTILNEHTELLFLPRLERFKALKDNEGVQEHLMEAVEGGLTYLRFPGQFFWPGVWLDM